MRLSFVVAMKSHLGILAIVRSIVRRRCIKGIATTEEAARVKYNVKTGLQLISALLGRALQTSR